VFLFRSAQQREWVFSDASGKVRVLRWGLESVFLWVEGSEMAAEYWSVSR
jgi:hypothetical protein